MKTPERPLRRPLRVLVTFALVAATAAAISSCLSGLDESATYACPNPEVFKASVSEYMERRCGTLDCHGGVARPMRLYGQFGLRHPDELNFSGGLPTTALELEANYNAVCFLQPEKMNEVVQNFGNTAEELLILRKARGEEKHKGGQVVNEADRADLCILGWLRNEKNSAAKVEADCTAAVESLKVK